MTIGKEKLVELLVDKTGMEEERVRDQLDRLISSIREAAAEGKDFEIENFGTFSMQDEGLDFVPSDTLQTEINHKYAGMEPIELIGAFKEKPAEEQVASGRRDSGDEEEPKPRFQFDDDQATEEPDEEGAVDESEPAEKKTFELDTGTTGETEDTSPVEVQPEAEKAPAVAAGRAEGTYGEDRRDTKEDDPIGKVLVAAVIVIVVGVAGWLVYDFGMIGGSGEIVEDPVSEQTLTPADTAGDENIDEHTRRSPQQPFAGNEPKKQEQQGENEVTNDSRIAEQSKSSIYGLRGGAVPRATGGYTIVIHSLKNESRARQIEKDFKSKGYVTVLMKADVSGTLFWRVGLGQFKTVASATEAIPELPEPYDSKNFIRKIQ